jgi:hypothetical protein
MEATGGRLRLFLDTCGNVLRAAKFYIESQNTNMKTENDFSRQ